MDRKKLTASLIVPALALILASCGTEVAQHDPATKYSADALASEFLFEYKNLKSSGGQAVRSSKGRPQDAAKGASKGAAATKGATSATLDDLIADTKRKALGVSGMSAADACRKVSEEVARDPSISEADKKAIAEALGRVD